MRLSASSGNETQGLRTACCCCLRVHVSRNKRKLLTNGIFVLTEKSSEKVSELWIEKLKRLFKFLQFLTLLQAQDPDVCAKLHTFAKTVYFSTIMVTKNRNLELAEGLNNKSKISK